MGSEMCIRDRNLRELQNARITVGGRHDSCIALRGLAAAEAALCLGILNCMEGL